LRQPQRAPEIDHRDERLDFLKFIHCPSSPWYGAALARCQMAVNIVPLIEHKVQLTYDGYAKTPGA